MENTPPQDLTGRIRANFKVKLAGKLMVKRVIFKDGNHVSIIKTCDFRLKGRLVRIKAQSDGR